ncbi:unnamed protein product, partial [Polarella glacialis]
VSQRRAPGRRQRDRRAASTDCSRFSTEYRHRCCALVGYQLPWVCSLLCHARLLQTAFRHRAGHCADDHIGRCDHATGSLQAFGGPEEVL